MDVKAMKWPTERITLIALIVLILYLDFRVLQPFLKSLTWAAILTIFSHQAHRWLLNHIQRPNLTAFVSVVLAAILIIVPAIAVGTACVQEGISFFDTVSEGDLMPKLQDSLDWVIQRAPFSAEEVEDWAKDFARTAGSKMAAWSASAARGLFEAVFQLSIMLLAMFYFYRDGSRLVSFLKDASPLTDQTTREVLKKIDALINATLAGNFVVALTQGFLLGLVFWLLGISAPVFWGVITGVIAFLPFFGAAPVWLVAAAILFMQAEFWRGIALLVLGTFVISGSDNVIRPFFVTRRSELTVLMVVIFVLGGVFTFGFLGVVLGPLLAVLTLALLAGYHAELERKDADA